MDFKWRMDRERDEVWGWDGGREGTREVGPSESEQAERLFKI